jgi:hypothetical protein
MTKILPAKILSAQNNHDVVDLEVNNKKHHSRFYEKFCSVNTIVLVPVVLILIVAIGAIWITQSIIASQTISKLTETLEETMVRRTESLVSEVYASIELGVQQMEYKIHLDYNSTSGYTNLSSAQVMSLYNNLLTMVYTNRATMSSVTLMFPHPTIPNRVGGILSWQTSNGTYSLLNYYTGIRFTFGVYTVDSIEKFFQSRQPLNPITEYPLDENTVIPTLDLSYYQQILEEDTGTGIITKATYIEYYDVITSGLGIKIFDENNSFRSTLVAFFYASSVIKKLLVEANPTKSGFIAIFQDDGVLIADSFQGSRTGDIGKFCDTDEPQLIELCSKIAANGGFGLENIKIPMYKTKHPKMRHVEQFRVQITTIKRNGGSQLRLFVVVNNSEFTSSSRKAYVISSGIAIAVLLVATIMIIIIINPISHKLSQLSKGFQRIQNLELDSKTIKSSWIDWTFAYELRVLQMNYESMVSTLSSFSKYVAPVVVKNLVTSRTEAKLKLERQQNCVIFFMDIQVCTSIFMLSSINIPIGLYYIR